MNRIVLYCNGEPKKEEQEERKEGKREEKIERLERQRKTVGPDLYRQQMTSGGREWVGGSQWVKLLPDLGGGTHTQRALGLFCFVKAGTKCNK